MGVTVESVTSDGDFVIVGGDAPVKVRYKTEAQERVEKQKHISTKTYLEPSVMISNTAKNDQIIGLNPFWAIFNQTSPEKLQAALSHERKELEPVCYLKSVAAIGRALNSGVKITNVVLLGSGSMHVGGVCVCCVHPPHVAIGQIAEALEISMYFGAPFNPLPLFVQDPAYSKMEKKFMEGKAIKVLDDPDAFGQITSETLLIGYGIWMSLFRTVSQGPHPTAILTTDIPACMRKTLSDGKPEGPLEHQHNEEILHMFSKYKRVGLHDEDLEERMREEFKKMHGKVEKEDREKIKHAKRVAPCLFVRR